MRAGAGANDAGTRGAPEPVASGAWAAGPLGSLESSGWTMDDEHNRERKQLGSHRIDAGGSALGETGSGFGEGRKAPGQAHAPLYMRRMATAAGACLCHPA